MMETSSTLRLGRGKWARQNNSAFLCKSNQSTIDHSTSIDMMRLEHHFSRHQPRIGPSNRKVELNRTNQFNPVHGPHRHLDQLWQTVRGFVSEKHQFRSSETIPELSTYRELMVFRGSNYLWNSIQHSNHPTLAHSNTFFQQGPRGQVTFSKIRGGC